jgi:hypothetical protein
MSGMTPRRRTTALAGATIAVTATAGLTHMHQRMMSGTGMSAASSN